MVFCCCCCSYSLLKHIVCLTVFLVFIREEMLDWSLEKFIVSLRRQTYICKGKSQLMKCVVKSYISRFHRLKMKGGVKHPRKVSQHAPPELLLCHHPKKNLFKKKKILQKGVEYFTENNMSKDVCGIGRVFSLHQRTTLIVEYLSEIILWVTEDRRLD